MSLVTRSTDASIDANTAAKAPQLSGDLYAGEALDALAACHIESDGLVYMSNATAADADARIAGFTPRAAAAGAPVTLFGKGTRAKYAASLTPGQMLYLAATDGRLDDAATTGDPVGVAQAVSATDIRILRDDDVAIATLAATSA